MIDGGGLGRQAELALVVRVKYDEIGIAAWLDRSFLRKKTKDLRRIRSGDIDKRVQIEAAGADVLFAPGLPDIAAVKKVCGSLKKPFNFMVGIKGKSFSQAELEAAGVKRISLATSLYRAAMTGLLDAAREVKEKGTFGYLDRTISTPDINAFMKE